MSIQWFPGHMNKARKQIKELLPNIHLIVEVLDARIPYSSENPMIAELRGDKHCIKVLTKSDLADPKLTRAWIEHFEKNKNVKALALTNKEPEKFKQILNITRRLLPEKDKAPNDIHVMIMGIPNVGKSTLINLLAGKNIAKTGNEPAITKGQQRINLRNGITLFDTPGMLWPKVENPNSGYRLATTGAIKDTAISHEDVAFFAADFLLQQYPEAIAARFNLTPLPETELELLEQLGKKRGCLRAGGKVDLEKVSTILLNEIRSGSLGAMTFESPEIVQQERIDVEIEIAKKKAEKEAKKASRRKAFSKR